MPEFVSTPRQPFHVPPWLYVALTVLVTVLGACGTVLLGMGPA